MSPQTLRHLPVQPSVRPGALSPSGSDPPCWSLSPLIKRSAQIVAGYERRHKNGMGRRPPRWRRSVSSATNRVALQIGLVTWTVRPPPAESPVLPVGDVMCPSDVLDPSTDDRRRTELAAIFASAILRLRRRIALAGSDVPDEAETCLEVPSETVLSGHHG